jgi:hypothetical protein
MARGFVKTRLLQDGKTKRYDAVIRIFGRERKKSFARKKDADRWLGDLSKDVRDGTYQELQSGTWEQ